MRDFDAADLEKFPEIASMTKEEVRDNEQLWSEIQRNRARNRRQKSTLKLKADIGDKEKALLSEIETTWLLSKLKLWWRKENFVSNWQIWSRK